MNTILVPVDFSETSDNALLYAVNLANYLSSNIILLHVNAIPVYNNEYNIVSYTVNDSVADSNAALQEKAEILKKDNVLIGDVEYFSEVGDFKTVMLSYISDKNIDLVVMGITGHDTTIGKVLFGSNAVSISRESNVPVFIISKHHEYKQIKNIAYASEYDTHITEQTGLIQIKNIAAIFGANLSVLHVIPDNHLINEVESVTDLFVEQKLEKTTHKTFILSEDKASTALLDFIKTHEVDVIVLEQKKHSFLHNLVYPSTTKEIAFNSPIPVLTIHS
ncbi:MAG: universal stress protein [Bacteroidia bacterium]|nr:universal stress protein [Bacteroidia bacterium]